MSARMEDAGDRVIVWNGNAARRGALTPELYDAIARAVDLAQQRRIRAIILTSEGPFFCAGGDLNVLIERRTLSEAERRDKIEDLHDLIRAIRAGPVPVIAAVKGGAAGAGASLALACDFIVAETAVKFTAAYVKAGLVPDAGLTASLARLLPRPLAMEMCLLAKPVTSDRLLALGAVNAVGPEDQVIPMAQSIADALTQGPRDALGVIRSMVAAAYEQTEAAQLDAERDAMAHAAGGDEAAEGIAAFLEKRPPRFRA
ncbi:oxepin-CoA hydrolase, alternative type [Tateyamaria pelophila]|uniref:oxepin-CoA hydrolase, alternative type n=1 Tax=Tateyamaria pelophila TaxID=328415 RepID=UPI001CC1A0F8|nr:enoyl-CoA hydratase family protein [Tateyamaria pelophila]